MEQVFGYIIGLGAAVMMQMCIRDSIKSKVLAAMFCFLCPVIISISTELLSEHEAQIEPLVTQSIRAVSYTHLRNPVLAQEYNYQREYVTRMFNTMNAEYAEQLVQLGKQFDMQVYTNRNHSIYGGNTRLHPVSYTHLVGCNE